MSYGKIINEKLIIAGLKITNKNGGTITRPTDNILRELGYKPIDYAEKPEYDREEEKLIERYTEQEDVIVVDYDIVALTEEEQLEIKKQKVISLEQQYNMCRWQRELILAENSSASDYTKTKAQEIEDLAKELR